MIFLIIYNMEKFDSMKSSATELSLKLLKTN